MAPRLAEVDKLKAQVVEHKERLRALRKAKALQAEIDALNEVIKTTEKTAREAQAKADAIDAAVYDLKAVNPNDNGKVDDRTPAEIIAGIEEQGKIVTAALNRLKGLLEQRE